TRFASSAFTARSTLMPLPSRAAAVRATRASSAAVAYRLSSERSMSVGSSLLIDFPSCPVYLHLQASVLREGSGCKQIHHAGTLKVKLQPCPARHVATQAWTLGTPCCAHTPRSCADSRSTSKRKPASPSPTSTYSLNCPAAPANYA